MVRERPTLIFTTLAMNQTDFFIGIAHALVAAGYHCEFICFHERSFDKIEQAGFTSHNVFEINRQRQQQKIPLPEFSVVTEPMDNLTPSTLLSHEKVAFGIRSSTALWHKFSRYCYAVHHVLERFASKDPHPILIQEVGGFTSILASFLSAKRLGMDCVFMEPSYFRGRVFFTKNSLKAPVIKRSPSLEVRPEVLQYLEATAKSQSLVIPTKDAWQYDHPLRKLLKARHFRRLLEKSVDKYVLGKEEEFSHIGNYVGKYTHMAFNRVLLGRYYSPLPDGKFIYFPLHVPADMAVTLRSPEYLDQIALLDFVARVIPPTHLLGFKEHPALIGAMDRRRIVQILDKNDNVVLLNPAINNYRVMQAADLVLTINSKTGAEALALGKKVIALGDCFYKEVAIRVERLSTLSGVIQEALVKPAQEKPINFFQDVWNQSFPGEIFNSDPENCQRFAESITHYLQTP